MSKPTLRDLRSELLAEARKNEKASAEFYEEEPDDMDSVENDTMSTCYGEAAVFLRRLVGKYRHLLEPGDTWVTLPVGESASVLLAPGEEYGGADNLSVDSWAMVLGEPGKTSLVLTGDRDQIQQLLRDAQEEIDNSYGAEHENALHEEYEGRCPVCQSEGPTESFFGPHSDAVEAALARDEARPEVDPEEVRSLGQRLAAVLRRHA
jgi:hypothetical protein